MSSEDYRFMARAIQLARLGQHTTHPNPRVGCVLVRDGQVVGEGYHQQAGQPHAEPNAIADAGDKAAGATAYVTLEPCCHHGRTPPCTQALITAGIKRMICAMTDPNPLVAGEGLKHLREAGISCQSGLLENEARALNLGFIKRMTLGLPYVRCKLAMSLDGRTAMASGESKWITAAEARQDVHRLRAQSAAILTGIGTVLADDPSLDVRLEASRRGDALELAPTPTRVILDTRLRFPENARMLSLAGSTLIVCGDQSSQQQIDALSSKGAEVKCLPLINNRLDLHAVMHLLGDQQINEILLESGPTLAGAMLQEGLIDELIIYTAPHLMGNDARGLFNLPAVATMAQRIDLEIKDVRMVGRDIRITAIPQPRFQ